MLARGSHPDIRSGAVGPLHGHRVSEGGMDLRSASGRVAGIAQKNETPVERAEGSRGGRLRGII